MAFIRMNERLECILIIIQAGFPFEESGQKRLREGKKRKERNE